MSRPIRSLMLAVVVFASCGGPVSAADPAHGVGVTPGEPLVRAARNGTDVIAVRVPPPISGAKPDWSRLDATMASAEHSGLAVVARLSPPRPGLAWRSYAAAAVERYGASPQARVRAWVVASPVAARIRFIRRIAGEVASRAQVLAAVRRRPPPRRVRAAADGLMFNPAARILRPLIQRVRAVHRALAGSRTELWLGPVGWSSRRRGGSPWASGLRGQRRKLASLFGLLAADRNEWGLDGIIWSRWRDGGGRRGGFGLIRAGGRAKPSLRAFRRCVGPRHGQGPPAGSQDPPPGGSEEPIPLAVGVAPAETPTATDLEAMRAAAVDVVRLTISREVVESVPGGPYDWSGIDHEFASLSRIGVEPLPTLIAAPALGRDIDDPAALASWRRFVTAAVERYGSGGAFWAGSTITAATPSIWQVWNEQNAPAFWKAQPSPVDYARLLDESAQAIRGADPGAQVMLGGMFGDPINHRAIDADEFLARLYEVPGARADFDLVATNPYSGELGGVADQVESLRSVATAAGDGAVPLWITELGWSSVPDSRPQWAGYTRTPAGQAEMLSDVAALLARSATEWNLRGFIWYTWRDPAVSVCPFCLNAGLLTADGAPKPALAEFVALAAGWRRGGRRPAGPVTGAAVGQLEGPADGGLTPAARG